MVVNLSWLSTDDSVSTIFWIKKKFKTFIDNRVVNLHLKFKKCVVYPLLNFMGTLPKTYEHLEKKS
jgi:hypothetical protein